MTYAAHTSVSVERTRAEIERVLSRYGAAKFVSGWDERGATVGFAAHNRVVRFHLPLPLKTEKRFTHQASRASYLSPKPRTPAAAHALWEQACRSLWRALLLSVKAKLEAVESGIATFEQEFLAHVVMPDGRTVGETVLGRIAESYDTGFSVPLLGDGT